MVKHNVVKDEHACMCLTNEDTQPIFRGCIVSFSVLVGKH